MRIIYLQSVNTSPDNHEMDKRLSVMEERMNTIQANLDKTLQEFKTDAEKHDKEAARHETVNTRWIIASILATAGLIVIILGFMLRFFWLCSFAKNVLRPLFFFGCTYHKNQRRTLRTHLRLLIDTITRIVYLQSMNTLPDHHELDKRLAIMEERMKTMNAQNENAIDHMNSLMADLKTGCDSCMVY